MMQGAPAKGIVVDGSRAEALRCLGSATPRVRVFRSLYGQANAMLCATNDARSDHLVHVNTLSAQNIFFSDIR